MWTVIKYSKNELAALKSEFIKKLGDEINFYQPKLKVISYVKSKKIVKDIFILGDYILCFHKDFSKKGVSDSLKYCKGLKYFLNDYIKSQKDIEKFVTNCKKSEDEKGYLKQKYFDLRNYKNFEFLSGPFKNLILTSVEQNKSTLSALLGKYKIIVSKENNLFRPI